MAKNVLIPRPEELEKTKQEMARNGKDKIHIISDFDRTLTTALVKGERIPSVTSILRGGGYLTEDYAEKAQALFDKYYPIEIDLDVPLKEKKKAMHKWWTEHFDLLIKSGLNKRDLEKVVRSGKIKLRKGALNFFDFLYKHDIPLVIISSAGLGGDSITMFLENEKRLYDNVYIISNSFEWDENGNIICVKKPIIHSMNKDETPIKKFSFYKKIKDRKNVLLLGDSLGDVGMVAGFDYENIIKIGFLNENVEENLDKYKNNYDVVILNDCHMNYVNKLMKEIIK